MIKIKCIKKFSRESSADDYALDVIYDAGLVPEANNIVLGDDIVGHFHLTQHEGPVPEFDEHDSFMLYTDTIYTVNIFINDGFQDRFADVIGERKDVN